MKDPWRGVAFGLGVVLIVTVGLAVAMAIPPGSPPPSSAPSPTTPGTATTPPPTESPAAATSAPPVEPSASASPSSPSPGPSATGTALVTATIHDLKVDAKDDPEGRDRQITFRTDEPATVTMRIDASPLVPVDACLAVNAVELYCTSGRAFTMTGQTSRSSATWTLTLRGQGSETPKLDVTLDFPAAEPTLTIEGSWFDGAARPDHNGLVIELTPRDPLVSISATWEGSQTYRLTVDEQLGSGELEFEGSGSSVTQEVLLAAGLHRIQLLNTGAGAERIALTATIAWR